MWKKCKEIQQIVQLVPLLFSLEISRHWSQKGHPDCSVSNFIAYFILVLSVHPKLHINITYVSGLVVWGFAGESGLSHHGKKTQVLIPAMDAINSQAFSDF